MSWRRYRAFQTNGGGRGAAACFALAQGGVGGSIQLGAGARTEHTHTHTTVQGATRPHGYAATARQGTGRSQAIAFCCLISRSDRRPPGRPGDSSYSRRRRCQDIPQLDWVRGLCGRGERVPSLPSSRSLARARAESSFRQWVTASRPVSSVPGARQLIAMPASQFNQAWHKLAALKGRS